MGIDLGTIHNTVIYNGYSMLDCPGIFSCQRYLGMSKTWLYSQNCNSTRLLGKIMINRGTHGCHMFRQTYMGIQFGNSIRSMVLISLPIYKTGSLFCGGKCWKTILEVLGPSSNPSDSAMRFEVCTPMFFHREFKPYSWPHPVEKIPDTV